MSDINELFRYYREECVPAYADLVGYLADKPVQSLMEIESAFAHVSQFYNPNLDQSERDRNLSKAQEHLYRLTLDCYKMLFISMDEDITKIYKNDFNRTFGINLNPNEFYIKYNSFKEKAQEARMLELTYTGVQSSKALDAYKETIAFGQDLVNYIDYDKINSAHPIRQVILAKEWILQLVGSFVAGLIVTGVVLFILGRI